MCRTEKNIITLSYVDVIMCNWYVNEDYIQPVNMKLDILVNYNSSFPPFPLIFPEIWTFPTL